MKGPQLGDEEDHVDGGANGITVKQSCEANRNLVAFDDLVAAHHLVSMFAEVGLVPPKIAFDDDTWRDVYEHGLEAYDVYIAIGLFSNCVTTTLNARWKKADQRCFAMSTRQEVMNAMRGWGVAPRDIDLAAWRAKEQLKSPLFLAKGHEDKANSDERRADIALIAKALTPNGNACLVVGRRAPASRGTRKAASFLRAHWRGLHRHLNIDGSEPLGARCFAALYEIAEARHSLLELRAFRESA